MRHVLPSSSALLALLLGAASSLSAVDADAKAIAELKSEVPSVTVGLDPRFGTARAIASPSGLLTGPGGTGGAVRAASLALVAANDPHRVAKAFIAQHAQLFGDAALLDHGAVVDRDYADASGTMRTVMWHQEIDGVPVQGARFVAHVALDGALIDISNRFVPGVLDHIARARAAGLSTPGVGAAQAVAAAVGAAATALDAPVAGDPRRAQAFSAPGLSGAAQASLTWIAAGGSLRLAWEVTAKQQTTQETLLITVDAADATVLAERSLTRWLMGKPQQARLAAAGAARQAQQPRPAAISTPTPAPALAAQPVTRVSTQPVRLLVFAPDPANPTVAGESPTPLMPGWSGPKANPSSTLPNVNGNQPGGGYVNRVWIDGPMGTLADPNGWIDDGGTTTVGNNAAAHLDLNASDPVDTGGPIATGAPSRDFSPGIAISAGAQDPASYPDAAVVNGFYYANFMHDRLYGLGFTEPDGNFQNDNFGRGGVAGDRVQVDVQDGLNITGPNSIFFRDNANFSTRADGSVGRMQMYVFDSMTPRRDGDLDGSVICHEYTHGLSIRLVGGGDQMDNLQSGGLGEGWSDFFALSLLTPALSDPNANYPIGGYVTLDWFTAAAGGPDPSYQNYYQGIRRFPYTTDAIQNPLTLSSIADIVPSDLMNAEQHSQGEIWCNLLWQARANWLGSALHPSGTLATYQAESDSFLRLIVHALKLTPAEPTWIEARDAILRADTLDHAGADLDLLWAAFVKRGLGPATEISPSGDTSVKEDKLPLGAIAVVGGGFYCGGVAGAVSGQSITYTVRNFSGGNVTWSAGANVGWITLTPASGTLAAGQEATVTAALDVTADALPLGSYNATMSFTGGSATVTRAVQLDITGDYLKSSVPFQWIDPPGATPIALPNDGFVSASLPFRFSFYGTPYLSLYVGSNGLLTFSLPTPKEAAHTAFPAALGSPFPLNGVIAPLWYDLDPSTSGSVTVGVSGSAPFRVFVVSWVGVPYFETFTFPSLTERPPLTFQVQLQESTNIIRFAYKEMQAAQFYGNGKNAAVGVEHQRGFVHTEWAPQGSVNLPNSTAIQFTYTVASTLPVPNIANAADGGSGQCGVGFGLPALGVGLMFLVVRRTRKPAARS